MGISLYASRIVLEQLGVQDFGLYNVVASISMFFLFMEYGVSTAMQRYFAFEIGTNNYDGLQRSFSAGLILTSLIALLLILIGEFGGIIAINHLLDIPKNRIHDAVIVYQFTLLIIVLELMASSFHSMILAKEKMDFFAFVSIAEAIIKLMIIFAISYSSDDRLITYSILLAGAGAIKLFCYIVYTLRCFKELRITMAGGSSSLKELLSFTGWNTFSSFADLCHMQGLNIVLNMFYGVALNAAMGITTQVKSAILTLSKNVQFAANPHIIKEYAKGDKQEFSNLIFGISRISFLILFLPALPMLLNTETILGIWLTETPGHTIMFIKLMICFALIDSLVGPLWICIQATGNIKRYQIVTGTIWITIIPTTYLIFKNGGIAEWVILIQVIYNILLLAIRLVFVRSQCNIPIRKYMSRVMLPLFRTVAVVAFILLLMALNTNNIGRLLTTSVATLIILPISAYFLAVSKGERVILKSYLLNLTLRYKTR